MKITFVCLLMAAGLAAQPALAACVKPGIPSVPDGTAVTENELLAAQAQVRDYVAAMDLYIACENEAMTADGVETTAEFLVLMSARVESARAEVDRIATSFNDQVAAFRATQRAPAIPPR